MSIARILRTACRAFTVAALIFSGANAFVQTTCADLARLDLEQLPDAPTRIMSARIVQVPAQGLAGITATPIPFNPHAISQYCEVTGYVAPQNQFLLRLPDPSAWNGKFFFSACAGFCGAVSQTACNPGLAKGYASVTSNGGHTSAPGFDAVWAAFDESAQKDFGYRSNHVVTLASKKLIEAYYGSGPRRSYMAGCSKGGQVNLMEALRYPEDFDGLITVAPVYDYTGRAVVHSSWQVQANSNGGQIGNIIDGPTIELIRQSVLARCDVTDGVIDGVVGDPYACHWKPSDLACPPGQLGNCLSASQVSALEKLYSTPTDSHGRLIFPTGYTLGSEGPEWQRWVTGRGVNYLVAGQYQRYLLDIEPRSAAGSTPLTFGFDSRDLRDLERARSIFDTTSVELDRFFARGGKILMWHGLADAGIAAASSIHYYLRAAERFGGRESLESSMRLFLLPGVTHCQGGDGSDRSDTLTALDNWVERGTAPKWLDTTKLVNGAETRLRRIYPYPKVTRYSGTGAVENPANPS